MAAQVMNLPYDKANQTIVAKMKKAGGIKETKSRRVGSEEVQPEPPPNHAVNVSDARLAHVSDHEGNEEEFSDDDDIVVRVIRRS